MKHPVITVQAKIDPGAFRSFALFDAFLRQKRWRGLALFAGIMAVFSGVCFAAGSRQEQAVLLGGVLLAVGLGLPAVYVISYLLSVGRQARRLGLSASRTVYTLHFSEEGVLVVSGKERTEFRWAELFCAYRVKGGVYLYANPRKAFLLPRDGQTEAVWQMITAHAAPDQLHDLHSR